MKKLLITGATGNVGFEVIKAFQKIEHNFDIFAGIRDLEKNSEKLSEFYLILEKFDFTDVFLFESALKKLSSSIFITTPSNFGLREIF